MGDRDGVFFVGSWRSLPVARRCGGLKARATTIKIRPNDHISVECPSREENFLDSNVPIVPVFPA